MHDRIQLREAVESTGGIRAAARQTGVSRNAVRRAIRTRNDRYYRRSRLEEEFAPGIRDILADHRFMPVSSIAILIGWPASPRTLASLVAKVRATLPDQEGSPPGLTALNLQRLQIQKLRLPRLEVKHLDYAT